MKYNNIIFLGLCLGLTTYSALSADSVIKVPDQNNILPYSARLKSTQKSVNPGLVSASATFTLEFQ